MNENCRIIFDTDMDTDCDDAGAFAMLLQAHLCNKAKLLGVVADSVNPYAATCCNVIAQYYGVNIPIGTIFSHYYHEKESNKTRFSNYIQHSKNCQSSNKSYNYIFAGETKKSDCDYPSAVSVYRKLLSEAEDNSVTVLCVGMLTAVALTLSSHPDNISSLSGVELFKRKVKQIITMGNPDKINDFNWGMDDIIPLE